MRKSTTLLVLITLFVASLSGSVSAQGAAPTFTVGLLVFDVAPVIEELTTLGYVEGENITYMRVSYEGVEPADYQKVYETQLQAMIDLPVDVLVVQNDTDAVNLREKAGDIPIVFEIADDPITTGAVADLTKPGGMTTGVVSNQHHPRRLQLLTEVNPTTKKVLFMYSAASLEGEYILGQVQTLGTDLGVEVIAAPITDTPSAIEALKNAPEDIDWIFLTPYVPWFDADFNAQMAETSAAYQAPVAGFFASAFPGYLINYGPDLTAVARQSADIVDQILRGALPADIPVVIAENGLVVNLEIAEALGMEIPVAILRQADLIVRPGDFELTPTPSN